MRKGLIISLIIVVFVLILLSTTSIFLSIKVHNELKTLKFDKENVLLGDTDNYLFDSSNVQYDNTDSGLLSNNVKGATDELYQHATDYSEIKEIIGSGSLATTSQSIIEGLNEIEGRSIKRVVLLNWGTYDSGGSTYNLSRSFKDGFLGEIVMDWGTDSSIGNSYIYFNPSATGLNDYINVSTIRSTGTRFSVIQFPTNNTVKLVTMNNTLREICIYVYE